MPHSVSDEPQPATNGTTQDQVRQGASTSQAVTVKNRRIRYLELHPEYFTSSDLELARPFLYDRLVRRFQSAAEREAQGRARGFASAMEADLVRGEAKLEALHRRTEATSSTNGGVEHDEMDVDRGDGGGDWHVDEGGVHDDEDDEDDEDDAGNVQYRREPDGSISTVLLPAGDDGQAAAGPVGALTREAGWARWTAVMGRRFVRGDDTDFDYAGVVDADPQYDDPDEEDRAGLDAYLDAEQAEFVGDAAWGGPRGETGVQDF